MPRASKFACRLPLQDERIKTIFRPLDASFDIFAIAFSLEAPSRHLMGEEFLKPRLLSPIIFSRQCLDMLRRYFNIRSHDAMQRDGHTSSAPTARRHTYFRGA